MSTLKPILVQPVVVVILIVFGVTSLVVSHEASQITSEILTRATLNNSTVAKRDHSTNNNNCTLDFIFKSCKPYKTFQSCRLGKCVCPTDLQSPLLKHDLTINTYWDGTHRQCVSKLNSVCFYLPPSILVSQPYRCIIPNAECVQAPGQFNGVGICKCTDSHDETSMGDCKSSGEISDNNVYIVGKKSYNSPNINTDRGDGTQGLHNYGNNNNDNGEDNSNNSGGKNYYTTESQCSWKFQCPHLQECFNGRCGCPSEKEHKNGYWQNMIWDDEEKICVSLAGSYCNNARFQNPHEDVLIKTILASMMEVRCAPGLTCEDSEAFEIGICNSCVKIKSDVIVAFGLLLVSVFYTFFKL